MAALIGAGASAEYLLEHVGTLAFSSLLAKPTGTSVRTGVVGKILNFIPIIRTKLPVRIGIYGGAYSSEKIEQWVDGRLGELLPKVPRPIKFRNLLLPTSIVASDLAGARAKIWSTETTPDDAVALAVRCSCSIPLFFEPVSMGNSRLVDGGLLSNLPAFVFSSSTAGGDIGGRILAFSLLDDSKPPAKWNIMELVRSLSNTLVGGATELQNSMQPRLNVVSIPTGSIRATDFDMKAEQIEWLIASGRSAVFQFIESEALYLRSELHGPIPQVDVESFSAEFVEEARKPGRELVVAMSDTRWFWDYFPTFLAWREAGASVKVFVEPPGGSMDSRARETQRRTLLINFGARIIEKSGLPFYGFFLLRSDENRDAAFLKNITQTTGASFGSAYTGAHNRALLQILRRTIKTESSTQTSALTSAAAPCILQSHPANEIIRLLKEGVWQYGLPGVTIDLEEVPLARLHLLVRKIRTFKFSQIKHLFSLYEKFNLPLFVPAAVLVSQQLVSVVTPPVLEEWGPNLVTIEGNTRVFMLHKERRETLHALVVRGVTDPLPGHPVAPAKALLHTSALPSSERIAGFNFDQFRSIEGSVRPLV